MNKFALIIFFIAFATFTYAKPEDSKFFGFDSVEEFVADREKNLKAYYPNMSPIYNGGKHEMNAMYLNTLFSLELILYYSGFPKEIFSTANYTIAPPCSYYNAFWDYYLFIRRGKVRDLSKVIYHSEYFCKGVSASRELIYEKEKEFFTLDIVVPLEVDLKKEKLSVSLPELIDKQDKIRMMAYKRCKKSPKVAKTYLYIFHEAGLLEKYDPKKARWFPLHQIYAYYKGVGGIKKDLDKVKYYVFLSREDIWKYFYSGFFAPQDTELALYILKLQNTEYSLKEIEKIKSGYYDNIENFNKNKKLREELEILRKNQTKVIL